jgi:hypothetical protein
VNFDLLRTRTRLVVAWLFNAMSSYGKDRRALVKAIAGSHYVAFTVAENEFEC